MSAQASLSFGRVPSAVRWFLWLASCFVGQGVEYFFFLLAKIGKLDLPVWLFADGLGFIAMVLAPAIFLPALAWHILHLGSKRIFVSLLQGVAVSVLAIVAGIFVQFILARTLSGLT